MEPGRVWAVLIGVAFVAVGVAVIVSRVRFSFWMWGIGGFPRTPLEATIGGVLTSAFGLVVMVGTLIAP